jgi:hypothetical protein
MWERSRLSGIYSIRKGRVPWNGQAGIHAIYLPASIAQRFSITNPYTGSITNPTAYTGSNCNPNPYAYRAYTHTGSNPHPYSDTSYSSRTYAYA